jgi:hypothetical protein
MDDEKTSIMYYSEDSRKSCDGIKRNELAPLIEVARHSLGRTKLWKGEGFADESPDTLSCDLIRKHRINE